MTETDAHLAASLLGRFRLVRRLGAGGMGTVFLAEQVGVGNRPVALKVLNRKLLDDPDFLLRFQNEAGSTGRIRHPNVVTIFESGQADDGTPYIAMEFLEGESLGELVKKRGALPVAEVVEITQQAAEGLDAAHDLGIIHRDLKPDNIFLTRDKRGRLVVKVVDFGIAKLRESATHTQTGMVLGTPAYMSFEQASGMRSDELDARSDIYSLGVVVYEMLTGRVPFQSDTPVGYLRKHLQDAPPPFRAITPGLGVPPAVESAVMKALVKDRNQRYASALDFARELTSAAQVLPRAEAPMTLSPTPTNHGGADRTRRRARALLAILASVIILGCTVGYILWRQTARTKAPDIALVRTLAGHTDVVRSVAFSPDGRTLASGSWDNTIKLWEVATGREARSLAGHTGDACSVAFSPDGRTLASGSSDNTIKLWDVATGREVRTLAGHTDEVCSVAFSPDGRTLASGSTDHTVKLWDMATGRDLRTLAGHVLPVFSVAFSPDGRTLASGSQDNTIKLWDIPTGREVRTLAGHTDWVLSVAFSPDGRTLASGSWDKTIKLWEVATGREVRTLAGHTKGLESVAFSPDGRTLASGSADKTIKLWEVATGRTLASEPKKPAPAKPTPTAATVRENPKDGLKYVWIPPGSFQMGCSPGDSECVDQEKPSHRVTISKGFWLGQTEVTVEAYRFFVAATGRRMPDSPNFNDFWGNNAMPIVNVSWDDAQSYCQWAGGRLPTEAEWEYAARGGSPQARYGPLDDIAWYADNSGQQRLDSARIFREDIVNYGERLTKNSNRTRGVGQKRANGFGLFDMLGNVWEWVNDWDGAYYYQNSPPADPQGPAGGAWRVLRGGSWFNDPPDVRVSFRYDDRPGDRYDYIGCRCLWEVVNP